jgi:uncharacterized protein
MSTWLFAWFNFALCVCGGRGAVEGSLQEHPVTDWVKLEVDAPLGRDRDRGLNFVVPVSGQKQIGQPKELFNHVKQVWEVVVEENQAGLVDVKQMSVTLPPLSEEEAWHHFQAGKHGIIDSARFLITFSLVPAVQSGGDPIHLAAIHNDVRRLKYLIKVASVNVDVATKDGSSALILASALGHESIVDALIALNANVEHTMYNGVNSLMAASSFGHLAIVKKLLEANALPNVEQPYAKTSSLHFASEMGHAEVIQALCKHGANGNHRKRNGGTPLHTAADANQTEAIFSLLTHCGSRTDLLLAGDTTALYLAAQRGHTRVCHTLVTTGGADPNFVMPSGQVGKNVGIFGAEKAKWYKERNGEIGNGATALHAAVENGHLLTTRVLLKLGAKQLTSMKGASPVLIALQYKHPRIALSLLKQEYHAHLNAATPHDGMYPLFVATQYGYFRVVERLLARGANFDKPVRGYTPYALARYFANRSSDSARVLNAFEAFFKKIGWHAEDL